jgi:positive regulator of sigma E activity
MNSPLDEKSVLYLLISLTTILVGYYLFLYIETLTYRVVLVFISLIILSNSFAKLYAKLILKEDV